MSKRERNIDFAWRMIFDKYNIHQHNFDESPFQIDAEQIKTACQRFTRTGQREVRILCIQTKRAARPVIFQDLGLFILPIKNGVYKIIKGEGYVDIPEITSPPLRYASQLDFELESYDVGDSEMQHLDYAYAVSIVRNFTEDDTLVLAIRGRKRTSEFEFNVGRHVINVVSVQAEVDSGYEGRNKIVLVEAKNSRTVDTIIRQLYYPYRQWQLRTNKEVSILFFEKRQGKDEREYHLWEFQFSDLHDYNSIFLKRSARYVVDLP